MPGPPESLMNLKACFQVILSEGYGVLSPIWRHTVIWVVWTSRPNFILMISLAGASDFWFTASCFTWSRQYGVVHAACRLHVISWTSDLQSRSIANAPAGAVAGIDLLPRTNRVPLSAQMVLQRHSRFLLQRHIAIVTRANETTFLVMPRIAEEACSRRFQRRVSRRFAPRRLPACTAALPVKSA